MDYDNIFFNPLETEFYLLDKNCEWNEQNKSHELLSVKKNYDEKMWHDFFKGNL